MKKKVVLAFSGGLDTSYCAIFLAKEMNMEVHAVLVNTGGFSREALADTESRVKKLNLQHFTVIDKTENFYQKCVRYLIYGNVLKNNTYPLSVSAERIFQAMAIVNHAQKIGAQAIAHGSTGAGNDQVRFDLLFQVMAPDIEIITPIRDHKLTRQQETEYLAANGFDWEWKKAKYSINQGLWGTSVGGAETLTSHQSLPEDAYPHQLEKSNEEKIVVEFEKGEPVAFNGKKYPSQVRLIEDLNELASQYAIGRDIHIGDTIIGIKGRVGFEAAAPLLLIKAHHLLEKHVLTKWQQYWKEQLGNWYGMLLHEGQYLEPVMRNIEKFLTDTQQNVSGKVFIKLAPYRFELQGIESPYDLMQVKFGSYGEQNLAWSGEDVKGFTKILSNQLKIFYSLHNHD
ncbi:MAG: argininosuccinate synthase [Cyclobacteriaceae bacterium]